MPSAVTTTDLRPQHGPPRLDVLGSPLHPLLSDYPATFISSAPIFDVLAKGLRAPGLDAAGFWVGLAGAASAVPTAVAGVLDYRRVGGHHPGKSTARTHGLLNAAALTAQVGSLWLRRRDPARPPAASLALGLVAAGLTGVSAHLGGELVYQHGFRVDAPEDERRTGP
jgi:uncharacterized membrane protein